MTSDEIPPHAASHERHGSLHPPLVQPDDESEAVPTEEQEADTMKELQVPQHPIPSMQGAFGESMLEAAAASAPNAVRPDASNASSRRRKLLDQDIGEDTHASKWKQKPGQRYHELWKLMAQISFGIYLLLNGIAKDEEQVLNILQGHVDEVDAFLESTLEDFDLALEDIEERLKFLKTPLENIEIFDAMLEDRQFRLQIVTGNERIEHIIHRTASAMNDALRDVKQGLDATKEFAIYLAAAQEEKDWKKARPDMQKVFDAMRGNTEGWYKAYVSLQTKGNHLGEALVHLGTIVAEMDKRAGEVSRKMRFSVAPGPAPILMRTSRPSSGPRKPPSHHTQSSVNSATSVAKNLPSDPNIITPAIRATLPAFQYVSERERSPEPEALEIKTPDTEPEIELEPFTLQPRTYSPKPQPVILEQSPAISEESPAPAIPPVSSARKRFSLKRKVAMERKQLVTPSTSPPFQTPISQPLKISDARTSRSSPDSAYGSDTDKTVPRSHSTSTYFDSKTDTSRSPSDYTRSIASPQLHQSFTGNYVASPRSDQQHFHPVLASPNSPLQRPWTAAPSNLRSTTSLSTMTQTRSVTENAKQLKKKKSGFGWLKKAFSLSEEEKAVFEEKRRAIPRDYVVDRKPQFLDGKRIR